MNQSTVNKEAAVALHKVCGSKTFARVFHLRVRESKPDLVHLVGGKEPVNDLDARSKKSHIGQTLFQSLFGARPHTGAFYIHTNKVHFWEKFGKANGILTLSTT